MWFSNRCVLSNEVKHGFSPCARYFLDALNLVLYSSFHFAILTMFAKEVMTLYQKTTYIHVQSLYIYSNQSIN